MLDLGHQLRGEVVDVLDVLPARFTRRDTDDLGVLAGFVVHVEHADRAGLDPHAGVHRVLEQHEGVQRITVATQRVGDEAVVGGIRGRGEQPAIEMDPTGVVIDLVFVAAPSRDLDHDVDAAFSKWICHAAMVAHDRPGP